MATSGAGSKDSGSGRRWALVALVIAAAVVVLVVVLAGGKDDNGKTSRAAAAPPQERPQPGGTLKVAFVGGGAAESLDPAKRPTTIDVARAYNLFEPAARFKPGTHDFELALGQSLTQTAPKVWRLKLRPGVTFHDGRPLTSKDFIYSLRRILDPKTSAQDFTTADAFYDGKKTKAVDDLTIDIATKQPQGAREQVMRNLAYVLVVPDGTTSFKKPIGTGPFMFKSFTPGRQSVFVKNPHYWVKGQPYVDKLELFSISDETARVNAVLTGQVDAGETIGFAAARQYKNSDKVKVFRTPGSGQIVFSMRVDTPPFNDVRVRQAFQLAIDRQQVLNQVFYGFGRISRDVPGDGLPGFDESLPKIPHDPAKAKALLAAAGHPNGLKVTLDAPKGGPGTIEAATVYAENLKQIGVDVKLHEIPADQFFNGKYWDGRTFGMSGWGEDFITATQGIMGPKAAYPETGYGDQAFADGLTKAAAAPTATERDAILFPLERQMQKDAPYVSTGITDTLDAMSPKIQGALPSPYWFGLSGYAFRTWWLK